MVKMRFRIDSGVNAVPMSYYWSSVYEFHSLKLKFLHSEEKYTTNQKKKGKKMIKQTNKKNPKLSTFFSSTQSWKAHAPIESKFLQFVRSHGVGGGAYCAASLPNKKTPIRGRLQFGCHGVWVWLCSIKVSDEEYERWKLKFTWHLVNAKGVVELQNDFTDLSVTDIAVQSRARSKATG